MKLILYFLLISTFYKFIFLLIDIFVFIKYKNKLKKNYYKRSKIKNVFLEKKL